MATAGLTTPRPYRAGTIYITGENKGSGMTSETILLCPRVYLCLWVGIIGARNSRAKSVFLAWPSHGLECKSPFSGRTLLAVVRRACILHASRFHLRKMEVQVGAKFRGSLQRDS